MCSIDSYCAQVQRRFWDISLETLIGHARAADRAVMRLVGIKAEEAESLYFIWRGGTCRICAPRMGQIFRRGVDPEPPAHPNCRCSVVPYYGKVTDQELSPLSYINRHAGIFRRPKGMPGNWVPTRSDKGEGIRYRDPRNVHNEVRIQKGDPNVSNVWQQSDYVKWKRHGQWMDESGKIILDSNPRGSSEAHIPIEKFMFDLGLFK